MSGSVVFAGIEGTRPILSEIQSLVTNTTQPMPRRAVVGRDLNRLAMILAVLSARYGKFFGDKEVYLNVAGGLKITEPSADLAVASAILSSVYNEPLPEKTVIFGEIGLSGEIRQVSMVEARVQEAAKLGFEHVILPVNSKIEQKNVKLSEIGHIKQLKSFFD